jgi:hypothetical protein
MSKSKCFGMMAACVLLGSSSFAQAGDLPGGYSCRDLRSTVASYGAELVLTAARGRGISEHEIVSIRRRCRV